MQSADLVNYANQALYLSLLLSLPAIIVAAVVGTLFAILQAVTQIQEQTLSYAVKLIATVVALAFTLRWVGMEIYQFTRVLFDLIPGVGR
jgi:type III secretion protein S